MTRTIRTDYAAVNGLGVKLYTFNDASKGRAWVRDNAAIHTGLHLVEVALTERRIYRPPSIRPRHDDFAIPACPA
jgi:hypothetical protein